jgi:nucleoside-diphosphate-sugar epimerase
MKILLTGSAGFTGLFFRKMALTAGHEVVDLQSDLLQAEQLMSEVLAVQPQAVLHLAGISFVGHENDTDFYSVNVIGSVNLLKALAALPTPPLKVLLASSANIYGNARNSPIDEMQAFAPVNHYAASKAAMEHMAANFQDQFPIIIARPFNYTGPGQSVDFLIPKLVANFKAKAPTLYLGNLHVEREFNDVRMVCAAYLALLNRPEAKSEIEVFNICSGKTYTLQDVLNELTNITGHQIDVKINPAFVRANEVHQLCGNPQKLHAATGPLPNFSLKDTLKFMLEELR